MAVLCPLLFVTQNSDIPIRGFLQEQQIGTLIWGRVKWKVVPVCPTNEYGDVGGIAALNLMLSLYGGEWSVC